MNDKWTITGGKPLHTASLKSIRSIFVFGAEWCDQTSTTNKLVEQLNSSLTEVAEEDVEEYRPVSRYLSAELRTAWKQITSPFQPNPIPTDPHPIPATF